MSSNRMRLISRHPTDGLEVIGAAVGNNILHII